MQVANLHTGRAILTNLATELGYQWVYYVRDIASELWKLLSDVLGEDIGKFNFRSAMERQLFCVVSSNIFGDFVQNGHVKVCADTSKLPEVETIPRQQQTSEEKNTDTQRQDLGDAPDITPSYGRTEELNKLKSSKDD